MLDFPSGKNIAIATKLSTTVLVAVATKFPTENYRYDCNCNFCKLNSQINGKLPGEEP